ncbi:MAG: threonylcarbamoyl-AMP synthase [Caldisphaeraceae archaeon]|nr:threonylcarbamoyl-AMP synthase [Caldisphaeraceae archaeon]
METLKVDMDCPRMEAVDRVSRVVKRGGLAVIPTDTVYGIIADPFSEEAVKRVYSVKRRDEGKPLPILLAESHHAFLLVEPGELFWSLAMKFWPGQLTIVEKGSRRLPRHLSSWHEIGLRLPACRFCRLVASRIGGAIIGTSANISGKENPRSFEEAFAMLGNGVDLYVDGGELGKGIPSTVVSVVGGNIKILRRGYISEEELRRARDDGRAQ